MTSRIALVALVASVLVAVPSGPGADAMIWCDTDPVGDVQTSGDAVGPPAGDIVDYCVEYDDAISLRVRTATQTDPGTTDAWTNDDTRLRWEIRPHGETTSTYFTVTIQRNGDELVARVNQWTFIGDWVSVGGSDHPARYADGWIVVDDLPADAIQPTASSEPPSGFDYSAILTYVEGGTTYRDRAPDSGFIRLYRYLRPGPRGIDRACPDGDVPDGGFDDVDADATHGDAINCVVWWEVASGIDEDRFAPARRVTRGQMARFIRNAMAAGGYSFLANPPTAFDDVDGHVHARPINQLAAAGVVSGVDDDRFDPGAPVSRGQMASFLVKAYQTTTGAQLYASGVYFDDTGGVHGENIDRAAEAGFAGGTAEGRYSPGADVRRGQMAAFIARMLDTLVENAHAQPPG